MKDEPSTYAGYTPEEAVCAEPDELVGPLETGQGMHCELTGVGHFHMDRALPFLCVYRRPHAGNDAGTARLIVAESAHLIVHADAAQTHVETVLHRIVGALAEQFGGFLLVELWSNRLLGSAEAPAFRVLREGATYAESAVERTRAALSHVRLERLKSSVTLDVADNPAPPQMLPLLPADARRRLGCALMGIELRPVYQTEDGATEYPLVLRDFRRGLSHALKRGLFEFLRERTTLVVGHYLSLGPSALSELALRIDKELAVIDSQFDFLLQVTPVNYPVLRRRFLESNFERAPAFVYRPCSIDPDIAKRRLYDLPIEHIEDPVIEEIFVDKREELARKLTMLQDVDTSDFLYGSLQLYGSVPNDVLKLAHAMLRCLPRNREERLAPAIDANAFAARAREEIRHYAQKAPWMSSRVEVTHGVIGLTVSGGNLLVGETTRIPAARAEALLAHEVGTHVVTYVNGQRQRLRLLGSGLVGYDELQEALAVLGEYLVGGLTSARLRLLAGRVIGARALSDGASLVETFRLLYSDLGFEWETAFQIAVRLYRGGGLVKDAIYLRGFVRLVEHLHSEHDVTILYTGKFGLEHLSLIEELRHRNVLAEPAILPSFLENPAAGERLDLIRHGATVADLVLENERCASPS